MTASSATEIKDTTGNPAPLGLLAFGMTTVLLNLQNAGWIEFSSMILAMGLCYGGLAQVIAGIMEWKKNNTFGATAFISYGMFWISLVVLVALPDAVKGITGPSASGMTAYLAIWGVFTAALFFGTLRLNAALQVVFATLVILYFLLALGSHLGSASLNRIAGIEGIFCGLSAMYTGAAGLLNELFQRTVLPVGPVAIVKAPVEASPSRAVG
ncbi:MAG: acetate uptake transporter [Opitutaceae bacterium]